MRKTIVLALVSGLAVGVPALADSKSAAKFVLETCLAAMDDLVEVAVIAGEHNWITKSPANVAATNKFMRSLSMWEVAQVEDKFTVQIWTSLTAGEKFGPQNVCSVAFTGKNINREEFFNFISASVELTFMSETRFPQMRSEMYEIKSDRANRLVLSIVSRSDGTLISSMVQEMPRFAPRQTAPTASPG